MTFLPDEAFYNTDAIVRTLARLALTKRKLLEWRTSSEAEKSARMHLLGSLRAMWFGPVLALLLAGYLLEHRASAAVIAAPILILWLLSPAVAWWLSRPLASRVVQLTKEDREFLEELAQNVAFFETFVGEEDNWLPPDNFQDYPAAVIAHRTSPTNIGLALLSNLTAYDFGFITASEVASRTEKSFQTLKRLERDEGHFFNWYDTRTLAPLPPRYISTVDSGNLVGHLLTLREGLLQLPDQPIFPLPAINGLRCTLRVLLNTVRLADTDHASSGAVDRTMQPLAAIERDFSLASHAFQVCTAAWERSRLLSPC